MKKTFKDYESGSVHLDINHLPPMPNETSCRYSFVVIDHATRWVFMHIYGDMTNESSVEFLRRLKLASPIKIEKILTDNGSQFTDRFSRKTRSRAAIMHSTKPGQAWLLSLDLHYLDIHKPTAWWNDSVIVLMNYCNKPESVVRLTWRRHC